MDLHLQIATEDYPDQRSIRVHVAQAREAVEVYNELAEATPVGRLSIPPAEPRVRQAPGRCYR